MKKKNFLPILITFDTDSDDFQNQKFSSKQLSWNGISEGIPKIKSALEDIKDCFGNSPKITWFVRADNEINKIYGDSNFIFKKFHKIWRECEFLGDEIGWHPHLGKQDNQGNWLQETNLKKIRNIIEDTYENFKEINYLPKSVRVGGTFGSNELNKIFDKLNILCNSSSFPGRVFDFGSYKVSWLNSPKIPYFPDKANYSKSGKNNYNTLQIPLTVLPIKALYDEQYYDRYLDLTFKNSLIKKSFFKILPNLNFIVTLSHPNIIINELRNTQHGLLSFDIKNLYNNLVLIMKECKKHNLKTNFMTINEFYEQFDKK